MQDVNGTQLTAENIAGMREDAMTEHPYITMRVEETAKKVDEIHEFIKGLAAALNSPMVKSMLPPNMRGMLGG